MKKLILILILFSCQKTIKPIDDNHYFSNVVETNSEEWNKTMLWNAGPFNYSGTWDMEQTEKGAIADARTVNSSFDITMWCGGIAVNTWVDGHFGSYTVNIESDKYSSDHYVNVSDSIRELRTTFSIKDLYPDNYKITITPEPDKTFIFHSMIKYVDFDPIPDGDSTIYTIPDPIDCDIDTIYIDKVVYDTAYIMKIDTIYLSTDTIIYMEPQIWIKADSLTYKLK